MSLISELFSSVPAKEDTGGPWKSLLEGNSTKSAHVGTFLAVEAILLGTSFRQYLPAGKVLQPLAAL